MSGAVIIRRCASAEEAAIVCALLNDAGIPASLENWHHATMDWGTLIALQGAGVHIPAHLYEKAKQVIIDYASSAEERLRDIFPDRESSPLPSNGCRSFIRFAFQTSLAFLILVLISVPLQIYFNFGERPVYPWGYNFPAGWHYERAGSLMSTIEGTLFWAPLIALFSAIVLLVSWLLNQNTKQKQTT